MDFYKPKVKKEIAITIDGEGIGLLSRVCELAAERVNQLRHQSAEDREMVKIQDLISKLQDATG